ncbi:hypothetical protein BG004_007036 [Podila humilis]|nr:hypothetical protein BG004_007036 [Podila humilis]
MDRTLARYAFNENRVTEGTHGPRQRSRIEVRRLEQFKSTGASRRPKAIDVSRVPVEYNPSQVAFVGTVGIGTPPQYFSLEFDIGMSDTWVVAEKANCTITGTRCSSTSRRFFHQKKSSTFRKAPNVPWKVQLTSQATLQGKLHTEKIHVAGFEVANQVLASAEVLEGISENGIDGSFGLGLYALTFNGDPTPIDNLIQSGDMKSEASFFYEHGDRDLNQGGELTFGSQDKSRYIGSLSYFNVPKGSVYWSTPVHAMIIVTRTPEVSQSGTGIKTEAHTIQSRIGTGTGLSKPNVIFDTSSNILLVPPRVALEVHRKIHNSVFGLYSGYSMFSGAYTVPCSLVDKDVLFDIWVDFGPTVKKADNKPTTTVAAAAMRDTTTEASQAEQDPAEGIEKEESGKPTKRRQDQTPLQLTTTSPVPVLRPQAQEKPFPRSGRPATTAEQPEPEFGTNRRFRISGKDIVRERIPVLGSVFDACHSGIQASKTDDDDWVFGNAWFLNNYMTLDHVNLQIGIAPSLRQDP